MDQQTRDKRSTIDETLGPVAELIDKKPDNVTYVNLDGETCLLEFKTLVDQDPNRIPMPIDREGYGDVGTSFRYWAIGHTDWINVESAVERYIDANLGQKIRLLDFGAATGRVLRHGWAFGRERYDLWGCDFAPANIAWAKRHLPSEIKFLLNTNLPNLPFEDHYFDVVTAFSVFTHIDEFEDAWLLELRRITKPSGLLYLTIQNNDSWMKILEFEGHKEHFLKSVNFESSIKVTEEMFKHPMPEDRIILRMSKGTTYNCNVWMRDEYLRRNWGRYFDVLAIAPNAHNSFQSVAVLRPK